MAINKVEYNGQTLIDLTSDTVTPETLAKGATAHNMAGEQITGTMENNGGSVENQLDDILGGTITEINSNTTKVIAYVCRNQDKLTTINLPNATSIGTYAFYDCGAITSVNAPKVTSLGTYSFYGSAKLKEVNFPLATSVPNSVFYSSGLTKADFGSAKSIGTYAFAYCNLKTLILRYTGGVVTLQSTSFSGSSFSGYIYVPSALVDSYKSATNWSTYASKFRAIEDYPDI